jgi:parallel beta-helix repeat protein
LKRIEKCVHAGIFFYNLMQILLYSLHWDVERGERRFGLLRKTVSSVMLVLLVISTLALAFDIQPVKASGTIYIKADGSIDPPTAPIQREGDTYILTHDIDGSIIVKKDNIMIDGSGYAFEGEGNGTGIDLSNRSRVVVKNTRVINFYYGVFLNRSSSNVLSENNLTNNHGATFLYYSSNNVVWKNTVKGTNANPDGIYLSHSSQNNVSFNTIDGVENGLIVNDFASIDNFVSHNTVMNSLTGMVLRGSHNTIRNNNMSNNWRNLDVGGGRAPDNIDDIDTSNVINGKPIYFWVNHQNDEVPTDAGYVGIVNSTNIIIRNLNMENNWIGILLSYTDNSLITDNLLTNNTCGLTLEKCSNNTISRNEINKNSIGIFVSDSFRHHGNNSITENNIVDNNDGIELDGSYDSISHNNITKNSWGIVLNGYGYNVISRNKIAENFEGFVLGAAWLNTIYNNNIENNYKQTYDFWAEYGQTSLNIWWDYHSFTGNYWSDYVGTDANGDGIGDTPYVIDANNTDRYPLVNPWISAPPNLPPNEPEGLAQFVDGTMLGIGASTSQRSVEFKARLSDPDGDRVKLQVELRNLHEYGGQFNETAEEFKESILIENGEASAYANELIDENYHWRARTVDEHGLASNWMEFGNNGVSEADFIVLQASPIEWSFAIITDLHIGRGYEDYNGEDYYLTDRLNETVYWIKDNSQARRIRFVAVLGDLTENGKPSEMNKAKEILDRLNDGPERIPYFPVIGNHEIKQFLDYGINFQNTFTNDFLKEQCKMLSEDVDPDLNWRIQESGIYYQNYAFKYENKRFVFLDWVDRNGQLASPACYTQTSDFLRNQLANGDITLLFSHHPMIDDLFEGAFEEQSIEDLAKIIRDTSSRDRILGSFGGHIHSYFDPGSAWNQVTPPKNPMFLDSRNIDYTSRYPTPESIPVYGTEALMSASYDPTSASRNVTRIVRIKQNTIETYVDCECPALNPYIYDVWITTNLLFQPPITTCWFTFYAFYSTSSAHSIRYSMYLNGEPLESPMSSSKIELVQSQGHVLGKGTYTLTLVVEGHARDDSLFSENISRTFTVEVGVAVVVACPVELVVTDPLGRSVGKSVDDIPGATYTEADLNQDGDLDKLVMIPTPIDGNYVFTLNGMSLGLYSLIAQFAGSQEIVSFKATEIPVILNAIHHYTVNWTALSLGEEGVAVQVDSNGDHVFEHTFTSDSELTQSEYITVLCDVNCDSIVDISDVALAARAFGSRLGHPRWNIIADINLDGNVNIFDIAFIAKMFGKHYS